MSVIAVVENEIFDYFIENFSSPVPRIGASSWSYIGLCSASPGESGTTVNELTNFTSPTTRLYLDASNWSVSSGNQTTFQLDLTWTPTGSGTATYMLLSSSSTFSSTHDFYAPLVAPVNYQSGDPLRIRAGQFTVSMNGLWGDFEGNKVLDALLRGLTPTNLTSVWFGLSTTAPNSDGTNVTEPTVGAYARTNTTLQSRFNISGASPTLATNTGGAIVWPQATASWGTPTHWVVYDASTGGNLAYYGEISNPTEVVNGLQPRFATGDLVWTID